jgi:hypothetical protein
MCAMTMDSERKIFFGNISCTGLHSRHLTRREKIFLGIARGLHSRHSTRREKIFLGKHCMWHTFSSCTCTTPIPKFFQTWMRQSILYNNCKRKFEVQTVEQNIFDNCKTQKKNLGQVPSRKKKKFHRTSGCPQKIFFPRKDFLNFFFFFFFSWMKFLSEKV